MEEDENEEETVRVIKLSFFFFFFAPIFVPCLVSFVTQCDG